MPTSKTLQSKIFATKKRLFDGTIPGHFIAWLALLALFCPLVFLIRAVSIGGLYTLVEVDIPVLSAPPSDASLRGFSEYAPSAIDHSTLGVVMTPNEFIFGDLSAFTASFDDIRSKFIVPHADGSPQVTKLLGQVEDWQEDRELRLGIRSDKSMVLIPDSRIPMNIIILTLKLLRESGKFQNVVLAGGLE